MQPIPARTREPKDRVGAVVANRLTSDELSDMGESATYSDITCRFVKAVEANTLMGSDLRD